MNTSQIEIKLLPIKLDRQKEESQSIARITISDSVSDEMVPLCGQQVQMKLLLMMTLAIHSDGSLPFSPADLSPDNTDTGEFGRVNVKKTAWMQAFSPPSQTLPGETPCLSFSGSHRVIYVTALRRRVHGSYLTSFKKHLRVLASLHRWTLINENGSSGWWGRLFGKSS